MQNILCLKIRHSLESSDVQTYLFGKIPEETWSFTLSDDTENPAVTRKFTAKERKRQSRRMSSIIMIISGMAVNTLDAALLISSRASAACSCESIFAAAFPASRKKAAM